MTIVAGIVWPLVWITLGFCAYSLVLHQFAKAVQPLRLRLAEEGEALLASGALAADDERDIQIFLDNAYNGWVAVWLLPMIPAAIFRLSRQPSGEDNMPDSAGRLGWWFAISAFAANPFIGLIVIAEFLLCAIVAVVATGSFVALRSAARRIMHSLPRRIDGDALRRT